jgi:tetratricopeptide (TPR) repeat protein
VPKTDTRQTRRQRTRQAETAAANGPGLMPPLVVLAVLIVATWAVFGAVAHYPFCGVDDSVNIYGNKYMAQPSGPDYGFFWRDMHFRNYMPVTNSVWGALVEGAKMPKPIDTPDGHLTDIDPGPLHTANLLFHLINGVLVFLILRLLLARARPSVRDWAAGAGALLFALHPAQTEPVAWISAMNSVLSGVFSLAAIYAYLLYALADRDGKPAGQRTLWFALATAAYVLALLAKATAVSTPLIAFALDLIMVRRPIGKMWAGLVFWIGLACLCILAAQNAQKGQLIQPTPTPIWFRPFLAADALTFYLGKLLLPINMGLDYGRTPMLVKNQTAWYLTWLIPAAVAGLLVWKRRAWRPVAAGGAVFLAGLLPMLGLAPHYYHDISVVADRYFYLALLGPALALAWVAAGLPGDEDAAAADAAEPADDGGPASQPKFAWAIGGAILLAYGALSLTQVGFWRDTLTLLKHTATISNSNWFGRSNLATALDQAGKPAEALPFARDAVRMKPDYANTHESLGVILLKLGQTADAAAELAEATRMDPKNPSNHFNYGALLTQQGKIPEAIAEYAATVQLQPEFPDAKQRLEALQNGGQTVTQDPAAVKYDEAVRLAQSGKLTEGVALFREVLKVNPSFQPAHANLGVALYSLGQVDDAIAELREAARLKPDDVNVQVNLGQVLSGRGQTGEAIEHFRAALAAQPDNAQARSALDAALKKQQGGR